ncbi:uncharacterized protein KQ657_004420 [Scheffersomyces spartinae]|uniref:Elongator complex protein 4 n=1 Tax=Scheffersomyces spartinae TaxID=45513 RepID=A0A9P7VB03_9ASCO|nr:uncharacterized protein KQ657_004420 [Scheffersomyces spartinae]KAG7194741.1 hypothetical protein KQ657_004420 [Scheffersomyces spartinae]
MSFRKRGEVVSGTGNPLVVGRSPALTARGPVVPGRSTVPGRNNPIRGSPSTAAPVASTASNNVSSPCIRPSIVTSQPTVSTGSSDLDKLLLHSGIPLGCSLIVEESSTTDFASVLVRLFVSQGVLHNRIDDGNVQLCHLVVVGMPQSWANDLPGPYKGTSKEQKKLKIKENEQKISVSNLSNIQTERQRTGGSDLKIAWRYGLNKPEKESSDQMVETETYSNYSTQFDLTQKFSPPPSIQDISFVALSPNFTTLVNQIRQIISTKIKQHPDIVIRIVLPNLLTPSLYSPTQSSPQFILPLFHSLQSLLSTYSNNAILMTLINLDLYTRNHLITSTLENIFDGIINLQPFNQQMSALIEKAYKNEPKRIQQGLVNVIKVPVLSERGAMMVRMGEYAFKNGKHKFEIESWGIPVIDEEDSASNNQQDIPQAQTTKNIDF